jgi:hypothetical protein
VRRGAAWPPAERPSSCLALQPAVSRAGRWPHRRAVMVAERRVCRRCPQQHGSPSQRCRGAQDVRMPTVPWSPCPRPPSASARPASARPVSDVRYCPASARPVSARLVSDVRCPVPGVRVRCPVRASGVRVRCPVRASGIRVRCPVRASGIRVHFGRTGELVERLGAAGSHTSRDRLRRVTYLTRGSLSLD